MIGLLKILPEPGRGTARRVVVGAHPTKQGCGLTRAPSVSRFASATSPFRGGFSTSKTTPVTLNSLQGPSLGLRRSVAKVANRAVVGSTRAAGSSARWMLKQVQHDEIVREAAE